LVPLAVEAFYFSEQGIEAISADGNTAIFGVIFVGVADIGVIIVA
jgi:hypothetical protein